MSVFVLVRVIIIVLVLVRIRCSAFVFFVRRSLLVVRCWLFVDCCSLIVFFVLVRIPVF